MWDFLFEAQEMCGSYRIKTVPRARHLSAEWFIFDWSAQFQSGATFLLIVLVYLVCPKRITFLETVIAAAPCHI